MACRLERDLDHAEDLLQQALLIRIPEVSTRLREELRAALDQLPEEQRLAVYLVDVEGFKYADAAEALEVSPGTVTSRVARGRRSLQKSLMHLAREKGWVAR